jgi:hypothetical protein
MQGGQPMSHGMRLMPIAIQTVAGTAGYATNLFIMVTSPLGVGAYHEGHGHHYALPTAYSGSGMKTLHLACFTATIGPLYGHQARHDGVGLCQDDPDCL